MSTKKKKKKSIFRSWFYRIYFLLILAVIVVSVIAARHYTDVLTDYEATRPVYAAQTAAKLFEDSDFDTIYEYDTAVSVMNGEPKQSYVDYMKDYTKDKAMTWQEAFSGNQNEKKYTVKLDGEKFATFTIVPGTETSAYGYPYWQLSSVTTNVLAVTEYTVTAPTSSTVVVNGKTLGEADAVETTPSEWADMLPDDVPDPSLTKYTFSMCFGTPEISVTDRYGDPQELTQVSDTEYSCDVVFKNTLKEQYEDKIVYLAQKIANYTSEDFSQKKILKYTIENSPAYKYLKTFDNQWCPSHTGYEFKDMETSDYRDFSDICFSVKVTFKYVIHYKKAADNEYDTVYTLYFYGGDGNYKLYHFTMY